ncbi:DegT/DnrJ/EryC1/StrS family aminotransferase [Streptomyces sp. JJ36]|uniref:DegT/DnrJ/EryC1/StrS family aminotransferase n=1 Tax=Streptomyces sp. JJ36 TaxID=2736645 RepID=UPI001F1741B1|nr:DegT/DnrJ/EryC1/StrS family aminotransferase [Streptomyces sp. JJ36]MCF6526561.1 DegT/DnrJ/EryC1/StrS family aminotransferase [Streptomyces sp. JJ36]
MGTKELRDAGVVSGSEVIVPAFGGAEVAEAVRGLGACPVFADIEPGSFCLDPADVKNVLTARTVAVAAVHLFGHPADVSGLREVLDGLPVRVVEIGAPPVGSSTPLPLDVLHRRRHAAYLDARLSGVVVPPVAPGVEHRYTQYVVRVPGNGRPDRDAFRQALRARGVPCRVPVKVPVHRMPGFRSGVRLPEAERAADECLALPVDAHLTKRELHRVASACNALGGLLLEPAC